MSATYADLFVHWVWGTFARAPTLSASIEGPLYAAMAEKCRELRCPPIAIGGMADHLHVLLALSPTIAVATLVKEIKGASAHLITHRLAPDTLFRWQTGYGAFTLRKSDTPTVRRYVLNQKEHHEKKTTNTEWEHFDAIASHKQAQPESAKRTL
jgi:REP element-mobilizing transposase RayT